MLNLDSEYVKSYAFEGKLTLVRTLGRLHLLRLGERSKKAVSGKLYRRRGLLNFCRTDGNLSPFIELLAQIPSLCKMGLGLNLVRRIIDCPAKIHWCFVVQSLSTVTTTILKGAMREELRFLSAFQILSRSLYPKVYHYRHCLDQTHAFCLIKFREK